ncbi:protein kinase domain-containing protein [Streptomyces sp. Tue6028]|uniref:serine/threonine-protein kinase n=1 Tax=Streptomyces sp. Tue6028 TaxID=2036037 RepID=UPI003D719962
MLIAGRYRLHNPIGRGAMGEVWRAFDEALSRPVAVKLLLPQDTDPTAASRFRLEAQTAGSLNHPHVVGVFDFGEHENRLFLVMELVEGDSLARLLTTAGPLPATQVAQIAAQAAAGLAAAHQQGIVHRDIKPANLLLDADGTLKIGDFGIARFVDDPAAALTTTGQIVGTSLYLAPERALGKPAEPACDVYALGCVIYQLLTGQPPFQADTAIAILHQHLDAAPVPPRQRGAEIPAAFENYFLALLAKQPNDRPSAQQVAGWFATGAWEGRPEPLPAPAAQTPAAPSPRHPAPSGRLPHTTEAGPATTYALPSSSGHTHRSHAPRRRVGPGKRGRAAHRPRVAGAAAGAVIFLAALVAGVLWFSPGRSSAEAPQTDTPGATSPTTTRESAGSLSDTPDPSSTASPPASTADRPEREPEQKHRGDKHGKHEEDEDD